MVIWRAADLHKAARKERRKIRFRLLIGVLVPVLLLAICGFQSLIFGTAAGLPDCTFNSITGFYCPGCGNTRSVRALMHGDILLALRNNVTMPVLSLLLILLYLENMLSILKGRPVKILPRKLAFWWTLIPLFYVYFIVRNFIPAIQPVGKI